MANVSIGPFLSQSTPQTGLITPQLEFAGYSLELAGDEFAANLTLYRRVHEWDSARVSVGDYYVCRDELAFEVSCLPAAVMLTAAGGFLPLESVLCALYREHQVARSLFSLLTELRGNLPLNQCFYSRRPDGGTLVAPPVAEAGFEVTQFSSYGRSMTISLAWVFPLDRQAEAGLCLHAAMIEFHPRPDRTLGRGKWTLPITSSLGYLLGQELKSLLRGDPARWLSEAGRKMALEQFHWSPVSLMTATEARQARIDFVRQHAHLKEQPKEMAKALKAVGLYSDGMELSAIRKNLPKLIAVAASKAQSAAGKAPLMEGRDD